MKYKIQDIKLADKPVRTKRSPEKRVVKIESREVSDYSWGMWFLASISVLFLIFSLSLVFARAKVTIFAKRADVPVRTDFILTKASSLPFEVVRVAGEEVKTIVSDKAIDLERKAHGTVILYNKTNQNQNLLIETRLSTPDGKIFKTDKAVTVPKGTVDKPGSVEVGVTADKPGEEYNVGLVDLKIVGFKGTQKYESLYGRVKEPLAGGLFGKRYTVASDVADATLVELRSALRSKLTRQLSLQTPNDYFVVPDLVFVDTTDVLLESEIPEIILKATGEIYGIILNKNNFSQELAKKNIADIGDTPVLIENVTDLLFVLENKNNLRDTSSEVRFTVTGDARAVWTIDSATLKEKLAGSRRKDFMTILIGFPAVEKAELKVLPFWKQTLPASPKNIKITVN